MEVKKTLFDEWIVLNIWNVLAIFINIMSTTPRYQYVYIKEYMEFTESVISFI